MLNIQSSKILFLGCGKMGSILLNNLLKNGFESSQISIIDPSWQSNLNIENFATIQDLPDDYKADIVFLAIKPQNSHEILLEFCAAKKFLANTIFISILAGKKIKFFQDIFGKKAKIIRTMPNLPIQENQGIIAYNLNKNINNLDHQNIKDIFANFGEIVELKDEKKFDEFTAIFGSGPAYVFYLQEIFLEIAKSLEIDDEKSNKLVQKLFLGSALMSQNSELNFAQLGASVTSKKGTTEAALEVLQKNNSLKKIFKKAIDKAKKKSKELSK